MTTEAPDRADAYAGDAPPPEPTVIVALDGLTARGLDRLVAALDGRPVAYKVGFETFVAEGPKRVRALVRQGFRVFLDLKFHDIPQTVALACRRAVDLGVWIVNVHASGGPAMLEAARDAVPRGQGGEGTRVIAVTVLTSSDQATLAAVGLDVTPEQQVMRLAALALDGADLDGLVCSAHEATALRRRYGDGPMLVTPGIRPAGSARHDQHRVMTPADAVRAGASQLVIGRPITHAADPAAVVDAILRDIAHARTGQEC